MTHSPSLPVSSQNSGPETTLHHAEVDDIRRCTAEAPALDNMAGCARGSRRGRAKLPGTLATTARSPLLVGTALPVGAALPAGAPSCTATGLAWTAGAKESCSSRSIAMEPERSRLLWLRLARRSASRLHSSTTPRRSAHGESSQEAVAHARGVAVACNERAEARPRWATRGARCRPRGALSKMS